MYLTIYESDFKEIDNENQFRTILSELKLIEYNEKDNDYILTEKGKKQFPDIEDWWQIDSIELRIDEITDYSY